LKIDSLAFDARGSLEYSKDNKIDLLVKNDGVKLEDLIKLLPQKYNKLFKDFEGKGELIFDFSMKGNISNTQMPSIKSKFYINNGELTNKKLDIAFRNITLNGDFSNGEKCNSETSFIKLDKFYFQWNKGVVKGHGQLFNFSNLSVDAFLECNLPLEAVHRFIQDKNIKVLTGNLNLDLKLSGDIKSLENIPKQGFTKIKMGGKGNIKSLNYSNINIPQQITNLNSNFVFNNSSIKVSNLSVNAGKTSLNFKGNIENILPFVFKQAKAFNLNGNLNLGSLNINDWLNKSNNKKDSVSGFTLPTFFNADLSTSIDKLIYKEAHIEDFHSRVILLNGNLALEDMNLKAFGGSVRGKASMVLNSKKPKIVGDIELKKVETSRFFKEMNEFTQNSITSKNIKGNVTAGISFSAEFLNKNLELNKEKLTANIKYKIENGEINEVPLLKKLSYFVEESALNNVKFKTIESNISIQNSSITFEEIKVKSNTINFSFLGKHNFNKNIDYRASIKLSELSSKKKKAKLQKQRQEFGDFEEDENSQLTLFVKIIGTIDKPQFTYDFKKNLEKTKENLKRDKEKITNSIDKDLKLDIQQMKIDKANWKRQEKGEYIIEWEEGKKKDTIKQVEKDDTKFQIEWE
ncbi:MAG: AsmA-like C-terminal region-containing protein, partial [Bacteroidales bacterium]|nr:AsmA-like C-terminal region-containing protein [Bacteroidales bacterium]